MFRRISYTIALQFTAFVFALLLVNGAVFLAADYNNARHQTQSRLARLAQTVLDVFSANPPSVLPPEFSPMLRERIRIADPQGHVMYEGSIFKDVPFMPREGLSDLSFQSEEYTVLTTSILQKGTVQGFIQVADLDRQQSGDLPERAFLYLLVSVAISACTFFVGLFFARRSLKPAEQMVQRLEQFTQDASHELRTPLAALRSSLDLALKTQNYRDGIESAKEDLTEVSVLVERLLELARLDALLVQTSAVDLSVLTETIVARMQPIADEKEITINATIAPSVTVQGDAALLKQVLSNLLSNAIKFSNEGGVIDVSLTASQWSVKDRGIGIAAAEQSKIFDRFYQADTSRAKDGFGLGLSLVKRIVDLHGWSIRVKSAPEKGTTFTVDFSAAAKQKTA